MLLSSLKALIYVRFRGHKTTLSVLKDDT